MIVFPLIAAGISAVFATMLFMQSAQKRKFPQLFWGIALVMFAIASVVVAIGISQTWGPVLYRLFWIFGVMLNVPWLALGSVALLRNKYITAVAAAVVVVASLWGIGSTMTAHVCSVVDTSSKSQCLDTVTGVAGEPALGGKDIPRGKSVWATAQPERPQSVHRLGILYSTLAYIVVILIAVMTSRPRKGIAPPPDRRRGNLLIAIGVTIVAVGGTALSRFGHGAPFSISLALGVAVMFAGFLYIGRPPRHVVTHPGDQAT